jgi:CHAT domain-containing protein
MDKIKILFLAANPRETGQRTRGFGVLHGARTATSPLRLDVEIREITAKIRASEHRDAFELIQKWAVRSDDLLQALLEHKPHIVHFCGHGNSGAQIILEDEHGHPHPVNKEALVNLFQTLKDNIRVVVLNACWTGLQAKEIVQTVDYAIGMNKPIGDPAAIIFAAWFYHAIGSGRTILEAYSLAKVALQLHRVPEDETPEIFVGDSADTSQRFHAPNPQLLNDGANVSQIPIRGYFGVETDRSVISGPSAVRTMDKVKILFLAANRGGTGQGIRELGFSDAAPAGTDALHLDGEIREITARIRASEYRDSFELIPKWAVRPDDLLQALLEHKPHMVHFSGHGSSGAETILQDANGRPQPLNLAALVRLFQTLKDNIRVVVLNACCTREEVEGLAKTIDFAVGMNQPIGDERAIVFAASFYETIGFGRTINEAFNLAKVALLLNGVSEDNTPEMFVRAGADASERFFTLSSQLLDDGAIASQIPIRGSPKELADRAKSTKDLVDLSWFIGNVATEWRYSKDQAESAYSQYRLSYEGRNAHVKILGKSAPVELAKIYTEVRIVAPEALRGYRSLEELHDSFLKGGRALAGYDLDRHTPRSGLDVANDTKNQFLSLLGAPGRASQRFSVSSA